MKHGMDKQANGLLWSIIISNNNNKHHHQHHNYRQHMYRHDWPFHHHHPPSYHHGHHRQTSTITITVSSKDALFPLGMLILKLGAMDWNNNYTLGVCNSQDVHEIDTQQSLLAVLIAGPWLPTCTSVRGDFAWQTSELLLHIKRLGPLLWAAWKHKKLKSSQPTGERPSVRCSKCVHSENIKISTRPPNKRGGMMDNAVAVLGSRFARRSKCVCSRTINISTCPPNLGDTMDNDAAVLASRFVRCSKCVHSKTI